MRKAEKSIELYVDAVHALRALELAAELEPKVDRARLLRDARATVTERMRVLTGGQIGEARRRLAAEDTDGH